MNAIKVCFIAPKAYPLFDSNVKGVFGGIEVDLYLLSTELAKDHRFNVSIITADYGQEKTQVINDVTVVGSIKFPQNSLVSAMKLWKAVKSCDSDIYFMEGTTPATLLVARFCKKYNRRFVYRTASRNDCDGTYINTHFIGGKTYRWALKQASQVIVQNTYDVDDVKRTVGVDSIVISNAHHLPEISEQKRDMVLWAGRSAAYKGPLFFLQLAEQFPEEKFVMICPCSPGDKNYESLKRKATKIQNFEFIEYVNFHDTDEYFQRAKVFVNTSDFEGFPNTFVQACKNGTPILSLRVNPDSFLDKYKCGFNAEGNWGKFVGDLKLFLKPEVAEEYGRNGLDYVRQKHDITKIIDNYKQLFIDSDSENYQG